MKLLLAIILLPIACISQIPDLKYYLRAQRKTYTLIGKENTTRLKTLDNKYVTLNDFKGKTIVADLWYGNCGPCFEQIPYFDRIKEIYKADTNILFINICTETTDSLWRSRIKEQHITGLNLLDERKRFARSDNLLINEFRVEGWPSYVFVDNNSKLQGVTYVKPQSFLLFSYYINELINGHSLKDAVENFKTDIHSDNISPAFKKFLTANLSIPDNDVKNAVDVYKPYFKN